MASAAIDWSHRIMECTDERFKILPDIVFKIVDQGVKHHVKAHKMILDMVSPKICMMLNEEVNQDKVKVAEEETKNVSLKVVIDAIYNIKSVKESLENRTVEHIFSVVNLTARCHLPELLAAALHCLPPAYLSPAALLEVALEAVRSNLPLFFSPQVRIYSEFTSSDESEKKTPSLTPAIVTVSSDESGDEEMISLSTICSQASPVPIHQNFCYTTTSLEDAREVLLVCAKFLRPKFLDMLSLIKFALNNHEHREVMMELQILMAEVDEEEDTKKTDILHVDWPTRIAQLEFQVSADVTFRIEDDGEDEVGAGNEVKAHKIILAMASPVFMNMLFVSELKDKKLNVIIVKETTTAAFKTMVEAIYNTVGMEDGLQGKTVAEIFQVLDLVVKYQIPELQLAVRENLAAILVTKCNVMEVAKAAFLYSKLFKEEARLVLLECAKYLWIKFDNNITTTLQFVAENQDYREVLFVLQLLMREVACPNCLLEPCQEGKGIGASQFRMGLRVCCSLGRLWGQGEEREAFTGMAEVVEVLDGGVVHLDRQSWPGARYRGPVQTERQRYCFPVQHEDAPTFLYSCGEP